MIWYWPEFHFPFWSKKKYIMILWMLLFIWCPSSFIIIVKGLSWSWAYGSWIYNYLCSQCLSLLMLWVRIPPWRGVLDTTLCDYVCQWLATDRWFSSGTPVSSINKTGHHDITEMLLKVALNTITLTLILRIFFWRFIDVKQTIVIIGSAHLYILSWQWYVTDNIYNDEN